MPTPRRIVGAALLMAIGALVGATAYGVIDAPADPDARPALMEPSPSILNRSVLPHYVLSVNLSNATWAFDSPTLGEGELLILPSGAWAVGEPLRPPRGVVTILDAAAERTSRHIVVADKPVLLVRFQDATTPTQLHLFPQSGLDLLFQLMRGPCLYGFGDGGNTTELAPVAFRALEEGNSMTITFHPRPEDAGGRATCSGEITLHPAREQLVVRLGDPAFDPVTERPA